ncbi:hypothetical protein CKA32_005906 [Geitlerinema sp. FC II]|nr:hypothetical protein CKA32_005906 [Geitlerinema sp. FC II]
MKTTAVNVSRRTRLTKVSVNQPTPTRSGYSAVLKKPDS